MVEREGMRRGGCGWGGGVLGRWSLRRLLLDSPLVGRRLAHSVLEQGERPVRVGTEQAQARPAVQYITEDEEAILGQCIGNIGSSYGVGNCEGLIGNTYGLLNPCGNINTQLPRPLLSIPDCGIAGASDGGSLIVQTSSPIAPGSISVKSENQIQGPLSVYGTLPFLSAVAFEGLIPTHGSGAVSYQCGDGRVAIFEENIDAYGYDSFAPGTVGECYNSLGAGWGSGRSGINGLSKVYGHNGGYGFNCNNGI